jgi:hypothetical protein
VLALYLDQAVLHGAATAAAALELGSKRPEGLIVER